MRVDAGKCVLGFCGMRTSEMGSIDRIDDRTFRVDFTVDGVAKLRDRVKEKLKEYMGDYTDDTLVVRTCFRLVLVVRCSI